MLAICRFRAKWRSICRVLVHEARSCRYRGTYDLRCFNKIGVAYLNFVEMGIPIGSTLVVKANGKTTRIPSHCSRCTTISFASIRRCGPHQPWPLASHRGFGRSLILWVCWKHGRPPTSGGWKMATKGQMNGMLGVYLAAAELIKQGFIVSPTFRSAMGADLLVTDQRCQKAWSVQVKTNASSANFWLAGRHARQLKSKTQFLSAFQKIKFRASL